MFEITWPNVVPIEHVIKPTLDVDWSKLAPLTLDAASVLQLVGLAPIVEGKPDVSRLTDIDLKKLAEEFRTQQIVFETVRDVFSQSKNDGLKSDERLLIAQLIRIVERFIRSSHLRIHSSSYDENPYRRRLTITLNMSAVVRHGLHSIRQENVECLTSVYDTEHPRRSSAQMKPWYTGKPCARTTKSHINLCFFDSTWESTHAFVLDHPDLVEAWAKNDHLGFEVSYPYRGVVRKYCPDFLVRLKTGEFLILETKGQMTEQDEIKQK